MGTHPVQLHVAASRMDRVQVLARVVVLVALGALGCSSLYWIAYLALPAVAALLVSEKGADRYLHEDGPGLVRALRWVTGAYAYLWLLTDALPTVEPRGPVELEIEPRGRPTPGSALVRLVSSIPAILLLVVLTMIASVLWVLGAIAILATGRLPAAIGDFIAMKLRYQVRLVAYHLSLVDAYPSLEDVPLAHAPHAGAA